MGYTHYWRRPKELDKETFKKFSDDARKILEFCEEELGIAIADYGGTPNSKPTTNSKEVRFNGSDAQPLGVWTDTEEITIPWPSAKSGNTFAGSDLQQRTAPINNSGLGSGSYETFIIQRNMKVQEWQKPDEDGLYFDCCKTAYRPYDIAVTACLIALKHYFPNCKVSSDGEDKDWVDGRMVCFSLFGYGFEEELG